MAFRVEITRRADADVAGHVAWLEARRGLLAAARWRAGLFRALRVLEADPRRYPPADEAATLGIDLRELLHGRRRQVYRVLFTIDDPVQAVIVHRVRHAAQDRLAPGDI